MSGLVEFLKRADQAGLRAGGLTPEQVAALGAGDVGANRVFLLGDSRTEQNDFHGPSASNGDRTNVQGYFAWANHLYDHRFILVRNSGVGGNTSADIVARLATDVGPYSFDNCVVWTDVNDLFAGLTFAQITANLTTIYDYIYNKGAWVDAVAGYFPAPGKEFSVSGTQTFHNVRRWIKEQAKSRKRFRVHDVAAMIGNASSIPANTPAAYFLDPTTVGMHAGGEMARALGNSLGREWSKRAGFVDSLIANASDTLTFSASSKNLWGNPLFIGAGGQLGSGCVADPSPDAGFTAGVPALWLIQRNQGDGSCAVSYGPAPDGVGNVLRLKITGVTQASTVYQLGVITSIVGSLAAGNTFKSRGKVTVAGGHSNLHTVTLRNTAVVNGITYANYDMCPENTFNGTLNGVQGYSGTFDVPPLLIPSGTLTVGNGQLLVFFSNTAQAGSATIDLSRFSLEIL